MQLDTHLLGVSRDRICDALNAEGVGVSRRYQNIHLLPVYQRKIAFGSHGFPWSSDVCRREVSYEKGICPVAERLNDVSYLGFGLCVHDLDLDNVAGIVSAFRKVWDQLESLH
jgi:dTDP-4-amino-4,6-dideoxygalactose transaminase